MPELPEEMANQLNIYVEERVNEDGDTESWDAIAFIKPVMGTVEGFSANSPEEARGKLIKTLEALCVDLDHVEVRTFWPNTPEANGPEARRAP